MAQAKSIQLIASNSAEAITMYDFVRIAKMSVSIEPRDVFTGYPQARNSRQTKFPNVLFGSTIMISTSTCTFLFIKMGVRTGRLREEVRISASAQSLLTISCEVEE